ncbi:MAG: hypothetical protein ACR2RL_16785, partial [Gammaproteobacteria bacterium]
MRSAQTDDTVTASEAPARAGANRYSKLAAHLFTAAFLVAWWVYGQLVESYVMPGPGAVAGGIGGGFPHAHPLPPTFFSFLPPPWATTPPPS